MYYVTLEVRVSCSLLPTVVDLQVRLRLQTRQPTVAAS
jgi:hypothetical protein